jgi:hypothetical protein
MLSVVKVEPVAVDASFVIKSPAPQGTREL